jgi:hypothetical protein
MEDAMKRITLALAMICLLALPFCAQAGEVSDADKAAIKQTALDYVDGFYSSNPERLEKALHPNLQKVTLHTLPSGRSLLDFNGAAANLIEYAAAGLGGKPEDQRRIEVTILDVFDSIATIKIDSADFLDFAHVAKISGEWKIINVLWAPHRKAPAGGGEEKKQ